MTTTYRIYGTTDDTDTCEVCGKIELRSVVMLAVIEDDNETGELIYAGTTCAARKLAKRGTRTTAARVRDAADAAARVMGRAREFAAEFEGIALNAYIAANAEAYLNLHGTTTAALAAARTGHADLLAEVATIRSGSLTGTRFAAYLPTL